MKFKLAVLNKNSDNVLHYNEVYDLTEAQMTGHLPLLMKRLASGEIMGWTVEKSEVEELVS